MLPRNKLLNIHQKGRSYIAAAGSLLTMGTSVIDDELIKADDVLPKAMLPR